MVAVRGGAIARQLSKNVCVSLASLIEGFKGQHCGTFAEGEPIALRVERATLGGGKGLQRIEAGENQMSQSFVTTSQNAIAAAMAHQFPRMADGIGTRSASVGDNCDWTREAEGDRKSTRLNSSHQIISY